MQAEFDDIDQCFDVLFNGDICSTCIHEPNCTLLKMVQIGAFEVKSEKPIVYCNFYQNRTVNNVIYWLKSVFPFGNK